ncbi:uncharacterized protein LOC108743722 [Agrilus planipennis]|uniref:Uncharacterized protein LOC108743722 n=1 Tax=Agrilus planipennis TaxID=224129 RepID=A0A1W4XFN6_AGRPL|nr:uncharacterized protein LOC108743722 [Agrilus planipennis]
MSFGLSGEDHASIMIGGDVVVAWVNKETFKGYADDYYLGDKSQCAGYTGSCPDQLLQDGTDTVRVLNAALVNGYSIVTYQRTLHPHDRFDRAIYTNQSQPIIWAIGPLDSRNLVSYHSKYAKGNHFIDFGRPPKWNCPNPESEQSRSAARRKPKEHSRQRSEPHHQQQQQQQIQQQQQQQQQRVYEEPPKTTEYQIPETTTAQPVTRKNQRRRGEARRRVVNNGNQLPAQPEAQAVNQDVERINPAPSTRSKQTINPTVELESSTNQPPIRSRQNRRRNNGERHEGRNRARNENVERENVSEVQQRSIPTPAPVSLEKIVPWTIPQIQCYEPEDGVFYAQMGPAGGRKGYSAITGHVGWGIAWYINGLLIPEINVVRGKTYTFVTEGGDDENFNAKYHPFYITDDPIGGYAYKTAEERKTVHIFAGAAQLDNGTVIPTGTGRLCHWTYKGDLDSDDYPSFGAFQRNLELKCEQGEPGFVQWTPTKMTPDTVYYQCFSHRYLGWKINVLDSCDELSQGSEFHPAVLPPPPGFKEAGEDDLETDASYRVATVVKLPTGSKIESYRKKNYALDNHKNITEESQPLFDTTQTQPMQHPAMTKPYYSIPSKNRLHLISRPKGGSQYRKRSHVVKKVIKHPKDMLMSEQRQNTISKRPVLKIHKRPIPSNMNFPRSKSKPERELTLFMTKAKEPAVELSPIQPSTEKMIDDILLSKYSKLQESLRKTTETPSAEESVNKYVRFIPTSVSEPNTTTLEFAVNTGFNPRSIVFERGFMPIMTERTKTITDIKGPEIENESEIGFLDIPASSVANLTHKSFLNHRYDDSLSNVKPFEVRKKRQKSNLGQYLPYEDNMPQSADNSKTYYLPPNGERKRPGSDDRSSSIFITYDGKKIHGSTLTSVGVDNGQTVLKSAKHPKAAELLRSGPQFAPFKGDLPPLDPKIINSFGAKTQQATLNRGLETPRTGDAGVTKLKLVPQRNKRYAHHTPEHTAEQMASAKNTTLNRNSNNNNNNNSSGVKSSASFITSVFSAVVVALVSYQFL